MTIDEGNDEDVKILRLDGDLDAATFESLIERGRDLYASGVRSLLIDMSGVGYMGSSGLVALHSLALILDGHEPPDPELGWGTFKNLQTDVEDRRQTHLKVVGPQGSVLRALERTRMTEFIEVHSDERAALDSF